MLLALDLATPAVIILETAAVNIDLAKPASSPRCHRPRSGAAATSQRPASLPHLVAFALGLAAISLDLASTAVIPSTWHWALAASNFNREREIE
jgi:hypothetical protein